MGSTDRFSGQPLKTDVLVRVFQNFNEPPIPFHADDQLRQVARFSIRITKDATPDNVQTLLTIVFDQLNRDVPSTDWGRAHRRRHDRSLSVGDVVTIGDQAWAYERTGWRRVTLLDDQIWVDVGRTRNGEPLLTRG